MSRSRLSRYRQLVWIACALIQAEWMIRLRPFAETAKRLSAPLPLHPIAEDPTADARQTRADLAALCRRLPWNPTCLIKAVAAHSILAKRRVSATLVLSVRPNEGSVVSAHAWLEAAGIVVTGKSEMETFVPIYRFDNSPLERTKPVCSH